MIRDITKLIIAGVLGGIITFLLFIQSQNIQNQSVVNSNSNLSESLKAANSIFTNNFLPTPAVGVDFRDAAKISVNAVVNVRTIYESKTTYYNDPFMEFFFGKGTYQQKIPRREGQGSGVIISNNGYIVTNNHVINNADKVEVTLNNRKNYMAKVIGTDPTTDLALLKIEENNLPFLSYGNSDEIEVGEWVLAVGNPFNLNSTVTAGIISAKGREINILENDPFNGLSAIESFIQTDAAVNPGNSGGALVNTQGQLVGINTAIQSNTGSYTGYSFAVPVNIVKKVVDDLMEFGMVQRAFIGVSIQNIDRTLAEKENLSDLNGIYISSVASGGAAHEAGIEKGDIIKKVGTITVKNVPELQEQLSKFRPGDKVFVTLNRDGKEIEKELVLRNRFGSTEVVKNNIASEDLQALGAQFEELSTEDQNKLNIEGGLRVINLMPGKLKRAGIDEGFIILKVGDKKIKTYNDLAEALQNKKGGVLIEGIYSNGMKAYYGIGM